MTKAVGKHFSFYLLDAPNSQIRIVAFKAAAEKFFSVIQDNKSFEICKVAVKDNTFNNVRTLQITLTTDAIITEIKDSDKDVTQNSFHTRSAIIDVMKVKGFVDIVGRIENTFKTDRIMANGEVKTVMIVTLRDKSAYIDATFWEHIDDVEHISPDEVTILLIESATTNFYKGAVVLNVGRSTKMTNKSCL